MATPQPDTSLSIRLTQFVISALEKWLTPIITAAVIAGVNWAAQIDPAAAKWDTQHIATVLVSAIAAIAVTLLTFMIRKLTKHTAVFQTILQEKGVPIAVDGWFGDQALKSTIAAINNPAMTVSSADKQVAEYNVKAG